MFFVRINLEPTQSTAESQEMLVADLWDAGTLGIFEGDGFIDAFFDGEQQASRFGQPLSAEETDWVRATEEAWPPILVGQRFFLVAPWRTEATPPGRFRLEINPGMQCGTGQHPCTRLCLEAMERIIQPGDRVLDVGNGSGILSVAAQMLGASLVIACDIDLESSRVVPFFQGSVDAVRSKSFDVVIANISDIVIHELKPEFERVAQRRILSGFQDGRGEWSCVVE
jgi:ribosomal protein L11 methyltransferase